MKQYIEIMYYSIMEYYIKPLIDKITHSNIVEFFSVKKAAKEYLDDSIFKGVYIALNRLDEIRINRYVNYEHTLYANINYRFVGSKKLEIFDKYFDYSWITDIPDIPFNGDLHCIKNIAPLTKQNRISTCDAVKTSIYEYAIECFNFKLSNIIKDKNLTSKLRIAIIKLLIHDVIKAISNEKDNNGIKYIERAVKGITFDGMSEKEIECIKNCFNKINITI